LTTHYMEEAEHLADRISVIAKGRIVAEGTAESLGDRASQPSTIRFTLPASVTVSDLPPIVRAAVVETSDDTVAAKTQSPLRLVGALDSWAKARGIDLPDLQVSRPTLEDIYLQLTEEPR